METEASTSDNYENASSSCSPSGEDLHRQVSQQYFHLVSLKYDIAHEYFCS